MLRCAMAWAKVVVIREMKLFRQIKLIVRATKQRGFSGLYYIHVLYPTAALSWPLLSSLDCSRFHIFASFVSSIFFLIISLSFFSVFRSSLSLANLPSPSHAVVELALRQPCLLCFYHCRLPSRLQLQLQWQLRLRLRSPRRKEERFCTKFRAVLRVLIPYHARQFCLIRLLPMLAVVDIVDIVDNVKIVNDTTLAAIIGIALD